MRTISLIIFTSLVFSTTYASTDSGLIGLSKDEKQLFERLDTLDEQGSNLFVKRKAPKLVSEIKHNIRKIQVALVKGATVIDVNTGEPYITKKGTFVLGYYRDDDPYTFFILNKQGELKYTAQSNYIVPVEDDFNLNAKPKHFVKSKRPPNRNTFSKDLKIATSFSLGLEAIDYPLVNEYQGEDTSIYATRLESKTFVQTKYGIHPGLGLSLQSATGAGETQSLTWTRVDIGPAVKYDLYEDKLHKLSTSLFGGTSLLFTAAFANGQANFRSNYYGVNIEDAIKTRFGTYMLGLDFRRTSSSSNDNTMAMELETKTSPFTSLGIYIGTNFDFTL